MNNLKLYKTKQGEIINLSMITQMYKRNDNIYVIELAGGTACTVTEEEIECIYTAFAVSL